MTIRLAAYDGAVECRRIVNIWHIWMVKQSEVEPFLTDLGVQCTLHVVGLPTKMVRSVCNREHKCYRKQKHSAHYARFCLPAVFLREGSAI